MHLNDQHKARRTQLQVDKFIQKRDAGKPEEESLFFSQLRRASWYYQVFFIYPTNVQLDALKYSLTLHSALHTHQ